jgi:hypothetical protein
MTETLDSALKRRLRAVLDGQPVTEAELRALTEQADACTLILSGLLAHAKRRLERLSANPTSSLAKLAATFRTLTEIETDLDELAGLIARLRVRARESRASWLSPGHEGAFPVDLEPANTSSKQN